MLKVLKAVAEQKDMTLGDLLEGIVLHAFEGKAPFRPQTLKEIEQFKTLYGMTLQGHRQPQPEGAQKMKALIFCLRAGRTGARAEPRRSP